ncbi:MAG: ABC transporter permease [Candidatus Bathyarchaeia archaeon]|jgi:ABC-type transport system involved in multi-copper enzyme maturation permease subunit
MTQAAPSWISRFWAVVRYEMLWNIRKKMFLGALVIAFVLATVSLALPAMFGVEQNPYFAVSFSVGSFAFIIFAIVTGMYSLSGEHEKGTFVPLLTKPVSRTMVFLGKLFAIFIVILVTYVVLFTYTVVGGIFIYGPQNDLYLAPLTLIGDILGTFIWVSIVLAAGALTKNSLIAILTAFGLFMALSIGSGVVAQFSDTPTALSLIPGSGATGTMTITGGQNMSIANVTINTLSSVSTGTDSIGVNIVKSILYPDANVSFYYRNIFNLTEPPRLLYTEPITLITARSVVFALLYIEIFLAVALLVFRRWQIHD